MRRLLLAAALSGLAACARPDGPPPIVVISLDTLRADRVLGAEAEARAPNLARLARESVVFDQAYAAANETLYSHGALFSGRWPSELAPLDESWALPAAVPTFATVLGYQGYATAAFVAGGHLAAGRGLEQGFGTWDDTFDWGSLHDTGPRALAWLDTVDRDTPWLLFVHGYDTHDRYLKPTPFGYAWTSPETNGPGAWAARRPGATETVLGGRLLAGTGLVERWYRTRTRYDDPVEPPEGVVAPVLSAEDVAHVRGVYDGAVSWADAMLGLFLAGLDARGVLDEAVVVVLSDHGEGLGEAGSFHHRTHLDDETTHVPLLVRLPGGARPGRVADLVSLLDVTPTLLELAGAVVPARAAGRSFAPVLRGEPWNGRDVVYAEAATRMVSARGPTARVSFVGVSVGNPAHGALLAHLPLQPPAFRVQGDPTAAEALRAGLVAWRAGLTPAAPVDPAVRRGVQAQGYWTVDP